MVKKLLLILLGGFAAFMVLAILQEWEFFSSAWFGAGEEPGRDRPGRDSPARLVESDRKAAADAVYMVLSLMRHYYLSDGDPRFADRMPAGAAVIEEMRSDVEYLRHNHRRQDPSLERLEVTAVEPLGPGRVEVRTREWWQFHVLRLADGEPAEPARSLRLDGKYLVASQDGAWRVQGWDFLEPEEVAGPAVD